MIIITNNNMYHYYIESQHNNSIMIMICNNTNSNSSSNNNNSHKIMIVRACYVSRRARIIIETGSLQTLKGQGLFACDILSLCSPTI